MEKLERSDYQKALYIVDMNNGFVNNGAMANPKYNELVPEQLRTINKMRREDGLVNFILEGHHKNAKEFLTYPEHCVLGTKEAMLIPELIGEQNKPNTRTYYKNSINGMLNRDIQEEIRRLKELKEVIVEGVCADLCVMDFARTLARYFDELDMKTKIFVLRNTIDTFDSPDHKRDEWLRIAELVMTQAGIEYVDNLEDLEKRELVLKLR